MTGPVRISPAEGAQGELGAMVSWIDADGDERGHRVGLRLHQRGSRAIGHGRPLLGDRRSDLDAFLPVGAITAAALGRDLHVTVPVSSDIARATMSAIRVLAPWLGKAVPRLYTSFAGHSGAGAPPVARMTGLFFTRGIDSWCSFLRHEPRVAHLLYVDGVEPRSSPAARERIVGEVAATAERMGRGLIVIETDVRRLLDPIVNWELAHGAVLAMAAYALEAVLDEVIIATSHPRGRERPWGTRWDLDPLWSTETVRFTSDGAELSRWEKTALVARSQAALDTLHVCWESGGEGNCGRCRKCLLTMTALHGVGVLERCHRFDAEFSLAAISALPVRPGPAGNLVDVLDHLPAASELAEVWRVHLPVAR